MYEASKSGGYIHNTYCRAPLGGDKLMTTQVTAIRGGFFFFFFKYSFACELAVVALEQKYKNERNCGGDCGASLFWHNSGCLVYGHLTFWLGGVWPTKRPLATAKWQYACLKRKHSHYEQRVLTVWKWWQAIHAA